MKITTAQLRQIIREELRKGEIREGKVVCKNTKTGETYEVLRGKGKGDLMVAMQALQAKAPAHMQYSFKD